MHYLNLFSVLLKITLVAGCSGWMFICTIAYLWFCRREMQEQVLGEVNGDCSCGYHSCNSAGVSVSWLIYYGQTHIYTYTYRLQKIVKIVTRYIKSNFQMSNDLMFLFSLFPDLETTMSGTRWRPAFITFSVDSDGLSTMGRYQLETLTVIFANARSLLLRWFKLAKTFSVKLYFVTICIYV